MALLLLPSLGVWLGGDLLLNRTGDRRERIVRVRANQTDRADYQYKDHGQHHGIFGNILASLIEQKWGEVFHLGEFLSSQVQSGWVRLEEAKNSL